MTREILFRGKRIDNGEWVEGNLFIPDIPNTPTQICIGTNVVRITYDIVPETVGQFTGLTDKNGKKIFEGDIFAHPNNNKYRYVVYWENETASFGWFNGDGTGFDNKEIEIIGNFYDNPELM